MTVIAFPDPQRTAADPAINAFVMANAGSGKTSTLVSRVARLLLSGSRPDAILCLTFTKAAAAEMQRRLYQRLGGWAVAADADLQAELAQLEGRVADAYDAADLSRARSLFARALETPGGLKIQTIHAFCEQLLRRFPVEAGVSPAFRVIDDAEAAAVVSRARDAVALQSIGDEFPGLGDAYAAMSEQLAHDQFEAMFARFEARRAALASYVERCGGLAGVPAAVAEVLELDSLRPPAETEQAAVSPPALDPQAWLHAAAAAARSANEKTDQPLAVKLQAVAEAVLAGEAPVDQARAIFLTDGGTPRKTIATKAVDTATCAWLSAEQERLCRAFDEARSARVGWDTVHALTLAYVYAAEYERAKQAMGVLDFADLIARARGLLTEGPGAAWVLYKLDWGIDHLLIDEAQDTSPEQWDIARALTEEFFSGAGARPGALERTVFVVGDEKQSIFSFQGAAPERLLLEASKYQEIVEGVGRPFARVPLLTSWRSADEILKLVDQVFAPPELASALAPGRVAASGGEAIEHVAGRSDGPGTVDVWPEEKENPSEERRAWDEPLDAGEGRGARRRVAERIVREVKALVARGEGVHDPKSRAWRAADWGDVLILVKTRGPMFEEVLRALKQSGVPVAGADRLRLAEHPVFEDLLALGRTALHPDDDLTLAGVLRSPLCDVSEEALFQLAHGRQGRLWGALRARADEDPAWAEARDLIRWFAAESEQRSAFDLFARLLNRRDARGLTQRQRFLTRLGEEAADAIDAFLDQARAAEGRGATDLERFCAALAGLNQTVKREMDEPKGEVRVMTAHSAKGLEAPIVILPDTIFEAPRGDSLLETAEGGFLWCSSARNDCGGSAAARALRKARDEEESLRLLYVGLTRARDRLIIGGRLRSDRKIENVKAWWAPLANAFAALGDQVREVETASGPARRFGADPQPRPRAVQVAASVTDAPAWLFEAPPREAQDRWSSPSGVEAEAPVAPSPLEVAGGLGRFRRGELIHRLFEVLPDFETDRRRDAAERLLAREPGLDEAQRQEMISAALAVLEDLRFSEVFGPDSRAEVAVAGRAPQLAAPVSGRVDRLVVRPDRVLVVDFKTNRPAPHRIEDADPAYLRQMAVYVAVLRGVFPDRPVEAALLWTDGPRLMPVPPVVVEQVLEALAAG